MLHICTGIIICATMSVEECNNILITVLTKSSIIALKEPVPQNLMLIEEEIVSVMLLRRLGMYLISVLYWHISATTLRTIGSRSSTTSYSFPSPLYSSQRGSTVSYFDGWVFLTFFFLYLWLVSSHLSSPTNSCWINIV